MAMSRKHYTEVAEIIKAEIDGIDSVNDPFGVGAHSALSNVADNLADMFKRDNSAFDRARFLDACGLGE